MATVIQKTWRGYFSRKLIHDFYALKRYLRKVEAKNQDMRSLLAEEKAKDDRRRLEEEATNAHKRYLETPLQQFSRVFSYWRTLTIV